MKIEKVGRGTKIARTGAKVQYGALCYRIRNHKLQVLLITTRGSGRWLIPKGWPIAKLDKSETAAQEAYEEAGVTGKVGSRKIGEFDHIAGPVGALSRRRIVVFPLKVKKTLEHFPEAGQRRRKWFSQAKAAKRVENPELAQLIREFTPKGIRKQ